MEAVCLKVLYLKSGFGPVFARSSLSKCAAFSENGGMHDSAHARPPIFQPSKPKKGGSDHCDEEILPGSNGEIRPCHDADMRTYLELTLQSDIWIDLPK